MNDKPRRPANDKTVKEADDATIVEGDQTIGEDDATVSEADDDRTVFEDAGDNEFAAELRRFRDYRVCEQFPATGGEADIYLTERGEERYILKLYRKGITPKEEVLKKAKELSHSFPEHIIRIYEYGYDERISRWYEVQEYARYGSLKEHRDGKLNVKTVLREISEALKVLHDHNILHLDLKPSNILIRETNPLDLIFTDFGVARALGIDQSKLDLSGVKGTLRYWSPEHTAKQVGREADYWSMGMIILELLVGYHPFEEFEDRIIHRTLVTEGVEVPDSLDADHALLLKGLLTRVPKQRWGYEQIKQWLNGKRDIPVYYTYEQAHDGRKYAKPYKFHEREYYTLEELMTAFVDEDSWEDAKAHLNRGWITRWLENSEDYDNHLKIEKIRAESASDPDLVLLRIIYTFNKALPFVFNGKPISPQNLYLYVGKTIRKENTKGEGLVAYALVLGKLFGYYEEHLKLIGKEKDDLHRLLASVPISFSSSTDQQDKITKTCTFLDTVLHDKPLGDVDHDLARAYYTCYPDKPFKSNGGVECRTPEKIGDVIEKEANYYKNILINKPHNADLYIYLETRGWKLTADVIRNLAKKQLHKNDSGKVFNKIILELQGKSHLKLNNLVFRSPNDMLEAPVGVKESLVRLLPDEQSKLSIWLEELHPELESNIKKWRELERYNTRTIHYALDRSTPFLFEGIKVTTAQEFIDNFAKQIERATFRTDIVSNSRFIEEANFWLRNYKNSNFSEIIIACLKKFIDESKSQQTGTETADFWVVMVIATYKNDMSDHYWDNMKPIVDLAFEKGFVTATVYEQHRQFLIRYLTEIFNFHFYNRLDIQDKIIVEKLRQLDPENEIVKKHTKIVEDIVKDYIVPEDLKNKLFSHDLVSFRDACNIYQHGFLIKKEAFASFQSRYAIPGELVQAIQGDDTSKYQKAFHKLWELQKDNLLVKNTIIDSLKDHILQKEIEAGLKSEQIETYEQASKTLRSLIDKNLLITNDRFKELKSKYVVPRKVQRDLFSNSIEDYIRGLSELKSLSTGNLLQNKKETIYIRALIIFVILVSAVPTLIVIRDSQIFRYFYDLQQVNTKQINSVLTEMIFVRIPPGSFMMGSPSDEQGRHTDETQHKVTISRPFYIQATTVTQREWKKVMGYNPSYFEKCGDDCPVVNVSWNDVQDFIRKLNQQEGTDKYRLPTEAEWEYASRAGSNGARYGTLDNIAWYQENSGGKIHPVGQKRPNAWGLYDMLGNVWQWCQDWYGKYSVGNVTDPQGLSPLGPGMDRVRRGGSSLDKANFTRAAQRSYGPPDHIYRSIGFRLVKVSE